MSTVVLAELPKHRRRWHADEAIAALRAWADAHAGDPPYFADLTARNGLPTPGTLRRLFGSRRAAYEAAGFAAPSPARRRPPAVRVPERVRVSPLRLLRLAGTTATVTAVAIWIALLLPQYLGGAAAYVLVSGTSMEPTYTGGDLVVALRRDEYELGDVIVYRVPEGEVGAGHHVIHRIIGGSERSGFVTRGDNRTGIDLWRPTSREIVGAVWFGVPRGGVAVAWLRAPIVLGTAAALLAFFSTLRRVGSTPCKSETASAPASGSRSPRSRSTRSRKPRATTNGSTSTPNAPPRVRSAPRSRTAT
jgi:signal peptidase